MRKLTKYTHQFPEMQIQRFNSAADSIFCLVCVTIMAAVGITIVYFVNTYFG